MSRRLQLARSMRTTRRSVRGAYCWCLSNRKAIWETVTHCVGIVFILGGGILLVAVFDVITGSDPRDPTRAQATLPLEVVSYMRIVHPLHILGGAISSTWGVVCDWLFNRCLPVAVEALVTVPDPTPKDVGEFFGLWGVVLSIGFGAGKAVLGVFSGPSSEDQEAKTIMAAATVIAARVLSPGKPPEKADAE